MAKVECYNCKRVTFAIAPKFRCSFCNYPLKKYLEVDEKQPKHKIIEDIKQQDAVQSVINAIQPKPEPKDKMIAVPINKPVVKVAPIATEVVPNIADEILRKVSKIKNENPLKNNVIIAGWLIVHTENKQPVYYEVFKGKNIIGRPDGPHHVDIKIQSDPFVSRIHCVVEVQKDHLHRFRYELTDASAHSEFKASTNGTYINGLEERIVSHDCVFLKDGDIIQVGETKLAFKNVNQSDDHLSAANSVLETDYTKTVSIKKPKL